MTPTNKLACTIVCTQKYSYFLVTKTAVQLTSAKAAECHANEAGQLAHTPVHLIECKYCMADLHLHLWFRQVSKGRQNDL